MPHPLFLYSYVRTSYVSSLSLHDALPISARRTNRRGAILSYLPTGSFRAVHQIGALIRAPARGCAYQRTYLMHSTERACGRSEEHTSELQSRQYLVCRLLLEKKKANKKTP